MKVLFISNFINHHQAPIADEMYQLLNGDFHFVETMPMPNHMSNIGYADLSSKEYVIKAWESPSNLTYAKNLVVNSDVVLFAGGENLSYASIRAKSGDDKLTFDVSERWLKKGWINLLSPRLLKSLWYYYTLFDKKRFYKLCASAFAAGDHYKLHTYKDKCYKWGYFTKVDDLFDNTYPSQGDRVHILWCARFLNWKHPELPVKLAARLKQRKYEFVIDMYGTGKELEITKNLAKKLGVEDVVNFCGNRPNDEILKEMRKYDIFLFTSDRNEGWGAVLNEAMSNGCAVVGSDEIGSVPFLIEDGVNGLIFKSRNLDSLEEKVIYLIDHPEERTKMAQNAYDTMRDVWSPENAAKQLLNLIKAIQSGDESLIPKSGPCSKAL